MRKWVLGFALVMLGLMFNFLDIQKANAQIFTYTGPLITARYFHAATLLTNGLVLITGGIGTNSFPNDALANTELFDPSTGSWLTNGDMSIARYRHTATLLLNGKVLVTGGANSSGPPGISRSAELYDPVSKTWTYTGDMTTNRGGHTATLLPNGRVLVTGGISGSFSTTLASAELYDPSTGTWTTNGQLSIGRQNHTATLLPDGKILFTGGVFATNAADLYDSANNTWTTPASLNIQRNFHTSTLLPNGKVLVAAGSAYSDTVTGPISSTELFDSTIGKWTSSGTLNTARYNHQAILLPNGKVLIVGGQNFGDEGWLSSAELYNPSTEVCVTNGFLNNARENFTATLLPSGQILIAGGFNNGVLASAELYNSSNVTVPAFNLSNVTKLLDGTIQFYFTNIPDLSFIAYGTTNLSVPFSNWTVLNGPTEISPGQYQLTDLEATNYPQRFYRLRSP